MRETLVKYGLVVVLAWAVVMAGAIQLVSASSSSPFWEKSGTTIFYNDGNVGIGTSAPEAKLDVRGTSIFAGSSGMGMLQIRPSLGAGGAVVIEHTTDGGDLFLRSQDSNDTAGNTIINDFGGNVGIGTAAPLKALHVSSDAWDSQLLLQRGSNKFGSFALGGPDGDARLILGAQSSSVLNPVLTVSEAKEVGIGTTDPKKTLHLSSTYWDDHLLLQRGDDRFASITIGGSTGDAKLVFGVQGNADINALMTMRQNGNVGIGTTEPSEKLDVAGNVKASGTICGSGGCLGDFLRKDQDVDIAGKIKAAGTICGSAGCLGDVPSLALRRDQDIVFSGFERSIKKLDMLVGTNDLRFYGNDDGVTDMYIAENGNIGIGTAKTSDGYKLSVNGKVRATEVVVYSGWADHVFAEGYNLMPLSEVASYIQANKRLPNVKSAAEIAENGASVGETQAKLLEKIEELTLYAIEQEGKAERQQAQIDALIREVQQLKADR